LEAEKKTPHVELCRWNDTIFQKNSVFGKGENFKLDGDKPIVYHLHGNLDHIESMVVTEDDYIDFMKTMTKPDKIPEAIQSAFSVNSLLFVGYSLRDLNFRLLMGILNDYLGISMANVHISIQLPDWPKDEEKKKGAMRYMSKYFERFQGYKIRVSWGDCRTFTEELEQRLVDAKIISKS
jgi:hypothetical protein